MIALLERWPLARKFDLQPGAAVAVVGAYCGLTMELLDDLYMPGLIVGFEPQTWAWERAIERLRLRQSCRVIPYGLAVGDGPLEMGEWGTDAASPVNTGPGSREHGTGHFAEACSALANGSFGPDHYDLMVMNVEGYEFALLPHLSACGWLKRIDRLALQPHTGFGGDLQALKRLIGRTHSVAVDASPAWVYWRRK